VIRGSKGGLPTLAFLFIAQLLIALGLRLLGRRRA